MKKVWEWEGEFKAFPLSIFLQTKQNTKNKKTKTKTITILSNGYLGSRNDEERSQVRYVMRIAEFSESSSFWTQVALSG